MFEKIEKKCPKAWAKFIQNIYSREWDNILKNKYLKLNKTAEFELYVLSLSLASLIGHLLLFFDEQGIYITPFCNNAGFFGHEIKTYSKVHEIITGFKTRTEAWQSAIPKAFEILEESL